MRKKGYEEDDNMLPVTKDEVLKFPKDISRTKHNMSVNERLKEARIKRGYTLKDVVAQLQKRGLKTGVSTIQGYEYDESSLYHRYPSVQMLNHLISLYGCSADYVFGISEEFYPATQDVSEIFSTNETVLWKGKVISDIDRKFVLEKIDNIMAL
jgi:transcriptional regulator with XRE-family HTH domain